MTARDWVDVVLRVAAVASDIGQLTPARLHARNESSVLSLAQGAARKMAKESGGAERPSEGMFNRDLCPFIHLRPPLPCRHAAPP